jgi:DNA modification methylase
VPIDKAEELLLKWQCKAGDLWLIGEHRLLCGDCTDKATVERLFGDNEADLTLTDPPYGVKRDKGFEGFGGFGGFGTPIARRQYSDDWDSERPSKETFDLLLTVSKKSIIFGGNFFADMLPQGKHWIVWDKENTMPTFGDCELAWTDIKRNSVKMYTVVYNGLIGKESERYHPTQKPVKLFNELLKDYSSESQTIYDPFLGSGTTMVATEQVGGGRKCFGCEISPAYCSVILERMSKLGLEPTREQS